MNSNIRKYTLELVGGKKIVIWAENQQKAMAQAVEDHGTEQIVGLHDNSPTNKPFDNLNLGE